MGNGGNALRAGGVSRGEGGYAESPNRAGRETEGLALAGTKIAHEEGGRTPHSCVQNEIGQKAVHENSAGVQILAGQDGGQRAHGGGTSAGLASHYESGPLVVAILGKKTKISFP